MAGLLSVPIVVRDIPDDKLLEVALIENLQRENLNPIEVAEAYHRLIEDYNLTQEDVAAAVGKDRATVANYVRLLVLPAEVQADVDALKSALAGDDDEAVKTAFDKLNQSQQKLGEAIYQSSQNEQAAPGAGASEEQASTESDEDVVDAEVVDEDEDSSEEKK